MAQASSLLALLLRVVLLGRIGPVAPLQLPLPATALLNGSSSSSSSKKESIRPVRIVSWNLLAPCYSPPEKYPWVSPEVLSWSHREAAILSELHRMKADIYCLQEVQVDLWQGFLQKLQLLTLSSSLEIRRPDYVGVMQNVTRGHPIANAIIFRRDKFQVLRQESRSRALILVLEQKQNGYNFSYKKKPSQNPLYLANVHLQAGIDSDQTRVFQLKSLMKRLFTHARMDGNNKVNPNVVVAGDFNMLPTNPVYRWLARGGNHQDNLTEYFYGTELDLKFPKKVHLLPLNDALSRTPPVAITGGMQTSTTPPSIAATATTHDEHTESIATKARFLEMTYRGGGVLDYLWTPCSSQTSLQVLQTMVFHPFAFQRQTQYFPSEVCPSDHLPIGADIAW